ncbi:reverse transcriptase domain-containing protein [Tanacetum coccineum]
MSAMANATPIVTTVTKTANNEKAPDAASRVNILDFCEEHYEDVLPIIMEKARRDKQKEVQTRLNFRENPRKTRRERENSLNSKAENSPTRFHPGISRTRGREKPDDRNVITQLEPTEGKSVHERLQCIKRWRGSESPSSNRSESNTSNGGHWKSRTKRRKLVDEDDLAVPWTCEDVDPFTPRIRAARVWFYELPPESIDGYKGLKAAFLAYLMQQQKYVKDPVEINNIKQRDGETIEDFMERFKVETGRMKGAPECMRISGFMHGVNNPELTASQRTRSKDHGRNDDSHHCLHTRRSCGRFQEERSTYLTRKITRTSLASPFCHKLRPPGSQGKERGLTSLPLLNQNDQRNPAAEAEKIQTTQPPMRMTRQKLTQSFACGNEITFPPLANSDGTKGPLVIEAEIGGHMIHRMYIDGGSSTEWRQPYAASTTLGSGNNRDAYHSSYKSWMNILIVRSLSPYNGIIERPGIREIQAVPSTAHGMLKFPANGGIVTIRSTILIPAECTTVITSSKEVPKEAEVCPKNFKIALHPNFPDQGVAIGGTLSVEGRTELCSLLKKNLDIFVWQPSDMTGVPRSVAEHRLNIREGYSPVRQKKIGQAPEHAKAIQAEIQMAELEEEKMPFHTSQGVYCYTKMPFGLKNAGATYQRLVDKAFDGQVGRNMEVYVDDLVIKSHVEEEMIRDINETFRTLPRINMKLNPKKYTFGAREGMFLGYVISPEGIKPCPDKTEAVLQLLSPRTIKEVQSLNEKLASLNRSEISLQEAKSALVRVTPAGSTKTKGRIDCILGRLSWSYFLVENPDENLPETPAADILQEPWTLFTDVSSCIDGSGAEYEALIAGLRIAAQMGVRNVRVSVDSKLVANQVLGAYVAKEQNMIKYLEKVKSLVNGFASFSISQVPRSKNKKADALSKITSTSFAYLSKQVLVEILKEKSIHEEEVATVVEEEGTTWMTPIIEYLKDKILPSDRKEASKLRIKARQYELLEGILYKRSFLKPWLRCIGPLQEDYVIREIHERSCIAMDYFTKWIEAKAVATITRNQVKKFAWDNIVCRFGLPEEIVSDNGKQFSDNPFKDWCDKLNITHRFASVKHPQSNRLVERANRSLGEGIKARLGKGNKNWT